MEQLVSCIVGYHFYGYKSAFSKGLPLCHLTRHQVLLLAALECLWEVVPTSHPHWHSCHMSPLDSRMVSPQGCLPSSLGTLPIHIPNSRSDSVTAENDQKDGVVRSRKPRGHALDTDILLNFCKAVTALGCCAWDQVDGPLSASGLSI